MSNSVAATGIVTVSFALALTLSQPISAQTGQPFTSQQCREAIIIGDAIKRKYNGRLSAKLIASFAAFRDSQCDLKTTFARVEGTADDDAYGEFRVRLIALRTSSAR